MCDIWKGLDRGGAAATDAVLTTTANREKTGPNTRILMVSSSKLPEVWVWYSIGPVLLCWRFTFGTRSWPSMIVPGHRWWETRRCWSVFYSESETGSSGVARIVLQASLLSSPAQLQYMHKKCSLIRRIQITQNLKSQLPCRASWPSVCCLYHHFTLDNIKNSWVCDFVKNWTHLKTSPSVKAQTSSHLWAVNVLSPCLPIVQYGAELEISRKSSKLFHMNYRKVLACSERYSGANQPLTKCFEIGRFPQFWVLQTVHNPEHDFSIIRQEF